MISSYNRLERFDRNESELRLLKRYLSDKIQTAAQCEISTGIHLKNICRRKRDLEDAGLLWVVYKGICPVTKYGGVQFLTCNKDLFDAYNK